MNIPLFAPYVRLLSGNRQYRWLWFSQVISLTGDWFNLIATTTLIAQLSGSGLAISGLFVARMLPPFLLGPVVGVIADRFDRRKILIAADLLRAAVVPGFLLVRTERDLWLLYAIIIVQLSISSFFEPARSAMMPAIVSRKNLVTANALDSTTWSTMLAVGAALGALLPENAIVADESISSGLPVKTLTAGAPPHDWLQITGGSIGIGMPLATGAAVACPDRKVICLEGDGSGMYTLQALWTQAREGLDVTTVVFANRTYAILKHELANVGAGNPGRKAADRLEIGRPDLDWVAMARGMGVAGGRAATAEEFADLLARGLATPGPFLIEAVL